MLLNILQGTGQPSQKKELSNSILIVLRLRNPDIETKTHEDHTGFGGLTDEKLTIITHTDESPCFYFIFLN